MIPKKRSDYEGLSANAQEYFTGFRVRGFWVFERFLNGFSDFLGFKNLAMNPLQKP
jgi:hypothetical protein